VQKYILKINVTFEVKEEKMSKEKIQSRNQVSLGTNPTYCLMFVNKDFSGRTVKNFFKLFLVLRVKFCRE